MNFVELIAEDLIDSKLAKIEGRGEEWRVKEEREDQDKNYWTGL